MVGEVIGGVVGGLFGDKGGDSQQQTASKEPWGPAAPLLEDYLKQNGQLNAFYQQNPFNAIQQQGYQNQLGDLDFFRSNLAPQLMGFANGQMGANYQRAPAGSELGGSMPQIDSSQFLPQAQRQAQGGGGGLLAALSGLSGMSPLSSGGSAGLLGQAAIQQQGQGQDGTYATKPLLMQQQAQMQPQAQSSAQAQPQAYFSAPQGQSYGQIDWARMNPFSEVNNPKPAEAEKPSEQTIDQMIQDAIRRRDAGMGWQPGWGDM